MKNGNFETLNHDEINELITIIIKTIVKQLQDHNLEYVTIDQLMYMRYELMKNPLDLKNETK